MNETVQHHRTLAARRKVHSVIAFVIVAILVLAGVALVTEIIAILVLFGLASIVGVIAAWASGTSHRHALAAAFAEMGLEVDPAPSRARRDGLFTPFRNLAALRHGSSGLRFWAGGEVDGRHVFLIEHSYTVHAGNSHYVVRHSAVATACPPTWPSISLRGQNLITGWWANLRGHDFKLENEAFNDRWIVRTDSEDFALLFLSPQVQEFLTSAPSGETWQIGRGWICWFRQKPLKLKDAQLPLERLLGLMRLIPPELEHWQG